ncbi:MAG TPA: ribonuclease HII [Spirochaetota bacterium]|nr:ribonuclease HII [Spirochaetota bacterium]HQO39477.1 ribonuclease HII [Spirochaetota bacterium]
MSSPDVFRGHRPDFSIEKTYLLQNFKYIAGVDEAGRGALAGPLSLGMVIYDPATFDSIPDDITREVADSKQLTHKKRAAAMDVVIKHALAYTRVFIPHGVIDSCGINVATELAVKKMLKKISLKPDLVIMDGNFRFNPGVPFFPVIKGDCRSLSIASASIIAKVTRDNIMCRVESAFPGYGFAKHKGYGTRAHIEALDTLGLCAIHRRSYDPVRSMLETEGALFNENYRLR